MDWFVKVFKPFVDRSFPTLPDREYTFIAGSSMGGLMTIYALTHYNHIFSRGAARKHKQHQQKAREHTLY